MINGNFRDFFPEAEMKRRIPGISFLKHWLFEGTENSVITDYKGKP